MDQRGPGGSGRVSKTVEVPIGKTFLAFYEVKNRFGHGIGLLQPAGAVASNFDPFLLFLRNGLFCQSLVPRPSLSERKIPFGPSLFSFHLRCLAGTRRSIRQRRRKKMRLSSIDFDYSAASGLQGVALAGPGRDQLHQHCRMQTTCSPYGHIYETVAQFSPSGEP